MGGGRNGEKRVMQKTPDFCIGFPLGFGPIPHCVRMRQESSRGGKKTSTEEKLLGKFELSNY